MAAAVISFVAVALVSYWLFSTGRSIVFTMAVAVVVYVLVNVLMSLRAHRKPPTGGEDAQSRSSPE